MSKPEKPPPHPIQPVMRGAVPDWRATAIREWERAEEQLALRMREGKELASVVNARDGWYRRANAALDDHRLAAQTIHQLRSHWSSIFWPKRLWKAANL